MAEKLGTLTIEDARLLWKNFSGRGTQYNREGDRNFHVVIPEEIFDQLKRDGWNVKEKAPREEGDEPLRHLEVTVSFREGSRPPRIVLLTSTARTELDVHTVSMVDSADIKNVDLIINPYQWEVNGNTGVKAYLKTMYVTINEDELEAKYGLFSTNPGVDPIEDRYPGVRFEED